MKRLVVFDFDGVIVDSLAPLLDIMKHACERIGHARLPTLADVQAADNIVFEAVGRDLGIGEDRVEVFRDTVFEMLQTFPQTVRAFPGMIALLEDLMQRHQVVIVTSNLSKVVAQTLRTNGFRSTMPAIYGAEGGESKHQRIERAAVEFSVPLSHTVAVGDAVSDVRAARLASVQCIAVTWGFHSVERLRAAGPDYIVNTPAELLAEIDADVDKDAL